MRTDPLRVVCTWPVKDDEMKVIAGADPCVRVTQAPYVEPEARRDLRRKGALDEIAGQPFPPSAEFLEQVKTAEVVYGLDFPTGFPKLAPKLKWVQILGAGTDHLPGGSGLFESSIIVTKLGGPSLPNIAEYVMSAMLDHVKLSKAYILNQPKMQWTRLPTDTLAGKTVGIVGLGRIGGFVARFSKAFSMRVLASRRTMGGAPEPDVDALYPPNRLLEMLPQCDFIVVATALTPETRNLIGERELRAMKRSALLINVARGEVVDEPMLIRALKEGWIAAAHLDVFQQEPLPPSSPLWDMPNVTITPHASAVMPGLTAGRMQIFAEQIRRYLAGEPLMYVVDKKKGY
ncbi:MAG: D-2-hydroxyacid dehydrogenase [Chloroflexi bacterium]|nr:D-2-hydroxyacid dehydrogenase [Chloroflexota bacterium]